ncbi:MAG: tRNA threonylcarbamoyladenosine dehydratase [Clostridia bacterium]|nr:tRNA threonylcarbamoyladenosine dehydratase [Clostridia bacterium]
MNEFSREELIIGKENVDKLNTKKVAVFGIGGVGSYVVEGLARAGIQNFVLIDNDVVAESNINRQLIALHSTIGMPKVEVAKNRILDINPNAEIEIKQEFYNKDTNNWIDNSIDYIIDAIDTVTSKLDLIEQAKNLNIPIISCMGTGNKLDATRFEIVDISKTSVCPLAKVMRKELKNRGIKNVKVLYSKEEPIKAIADETNGKHAPGSISFVPSVAGLLIAGEVIKDLIK